jgi:hypothetical protein
MLASANPRSADLLLYDNFHIEGTATIAMDTSPRTPRAAAFAAPPAHKRSGSAGTDANSEPLRAHAASSSPLSASATSPSFWSIGGFKPVVERAIAGEKALKHVERMFEERLVGACG